MRACVLMCVYDCLCFCINAFFYINYVFSSLNFNSQNGKVRQCTKRSNVCTSAFTFFQSSCDSILVFIFTYFIKFIRKCIV